VSNGTLWIGTKRYSSWSMRGWLAVRLAELDVAEVVIPLKPAGTPELASVSPSGLVPALRYRDHLVWESLAICEFCAEFSPAIWPDDFSARTHARAVSAEMHGGFRGLRTAMPMNLGRRFPGRGRTPEALADIARIEALWAATRERFGAGGPFLFGASFNAADAMFAPVVARFLTWEPELSAASRAYCDAVRAHPLVARWHEEAAAEPEAWLLDKYENPGT
jgi:glutathione S-transferase